MNLSKLSIALSFGGQGSKIVLLKNNHFRKGSSALNDATKDKTIIEGEFSADPNVNPALVTGSINNIGALKFTIKKGTVNGVKSLKNILKDSGINVQLFFNSNLKIMANNSYFVLLFSLSGKTIHSKMAIAPGVDFHGEHSYVHLPTSSYKEGYDQIEWEFDGVDEHNFDPETNYFENINELPEWLEQLLQTDCPTDAVWKDEITEDEVVEGCMNGVSGANAKTVLHNALVRLRGLDTERDVILYVAQTAAAESGPEITEKWAKNCAWYVMNQYRPINRTISAPPQDKSALNSSLYD